MPSSDKKSDDLIAQVLSAEGSAISTFNDIWTNAKRNSEIYSLGHWTDVEKAKIIAQNRIPYIFDKISHPMNILLGTQRDTRFDIYFYERRPEDATRAEVFNALWKYFSDLYDFIHVESEVFQDAVVSAYGCFGIDFDRRKDYRGNIRVHRVPFDEIIWDTNTRQYDLTDCNWMTRMRWYRKEDLIEKYPDVDPQMIMMSGRDQTWQNTKLKMDLWYDPVKQLVGTREFFQRSWKTKHLIWQQGQSEPDDAQFDTKKDAEKEIKNRLFQYDLASSQAASVMQTLPFERPSYEVIDFPLWGVSRAVVMINGILEPEEEFELGDYPNTPYFAYFNDGTFWSAIDRMKDPQLFTNRMYAQIDYSIGTMAKGALRMDPKLPDNVKNAIRDGWGKTAFTFTAKKDQVEMFESRGLPPQMFSVLDRVETNIQDNLGGANFLGLKQTASESGRAVLARQSQAGLDNFIPLDNLRRTKQNLGEKIAWYISNKISEARQFRIVGDSLSMQLLQEKNVAQVNPARPNVGYVTVNTTPENSIQGLEVDIVVDEAQHSPTKNMAIVASLVDAGKAGLITVPPPPEAVISILDAPESFKQLWLKEVARIQQQPPKEEPPKVSINFKDVPPSSKAEALQKAGIPAQASEVFAHEVLNKPHLTQAEISGNGQGNP